MDIQGLSDALLRLTVIYHQIIAVLDACAFPTQNHLYGYDTL